ncbi:hypothetical protein B0T16DRAFT_457435 [Cercophora newfieldiana]|uniref:Peptidase M14 domain-containing protein n=1 Tax=Cercophora newfieldiana TaxID=92897 RepID=A0AA40CNZ6_9PEZI|nr:hypothetical protein B0T16DRAFT_457435 [Cercophora newfieldiana]
MKSLLLSSLLFASAALGTRVPGANGKITYDGYKAFRIHTGENEALVKELVESLPEAIKFNMDTAEHLDLVVPPKELKAFEALNLDSVVIYEDLGADIRAEGDFATYETTAARAVPSLTWFNSYHAYADHVTFFNDLAGAFPSNSEIFTVGQSLQGRDIFGIHLWGSGGKGSKPAVYFHGTVHAREWISAKVVEYVTYQLLVNYSTDAAVKAILDKYDFYILPFVNPDGFVYTQTTNRLWRKNRQTRSGSSCVGTDINRNWPYKWELTNGASTNPCDETYKGQAAGDTPENKALVAFTKTLVASKGIKLYIDWHSYGNYILTPYGYSCSATPSNNARQLELARGLNTRIQQSYGTRHTVGGACSTLYATTGDSTDYLTDVSKAEFAWTIELRPGSGTSNGFVLPAAQILPSGVEQWEGMKYLLATM